MEDLNDVSPYLKLPARTYTQAQAALEVTAALPYRVALARIAGLAKVGPKFFGLSEEAQITLLCEMIDAMREIADRALGIEQKKVEDRDYREATTRDAPLDEGYDISD